MYHKSTQLTQRSKNYFFSSDRSLKCHSIRLSRTNRSLFSFPAHISKQTSNDFIMTSVRVSLSSIADLPQVSLKTVSSHNLLRHTVGAQSTFVLNRFIISRQFILAGSHSIQLCQRFITFMCVSVHSTELSTFTTKL